MSKTEGLSISESVSFSHSGRTRGKAGAAALAVALTASGCGLIKETPDGTARPEASQAASAPARFYEETVQFEVGAPTFADFRDASGPGAVYKKGAKVMVRCVVANAPVEAAPSAKGTWYLLNEQQKGQNMYTPANVYENASDLSLPLSEQNAVDPAVPPCRAADTAPIPLPPANRPSAGEPS